MHPYRYGPHEPKRHRREAAWHRRWWELVRFLEEHQRFPRELSSESEIERRLAGWLRYQRRRAQRGTMTPRQRELLNQIGKFEWDPLNDRWWGQLSRLQQFLEVERRMPRYR